MPAAAPPASSFCNAMVRAGAVRALLHSLHTNPTPAGPSTPLEPSQGILLCSNSHSPTMLNTASTRAAAGPRPCLHALHAPSSGVTQITLGRNSSFPSSRSSYAADAWHQDHRRRGACSIRCQAEEGAGAADTGEMSQLLERERKIRDVADALNTSRENAARILQMRPGLMLVSLRMHTRTCPVHAWDLFPHQCTHGHALPCSVRSSRT
jgi:hypothetical protein